MNVERVTLESLNEAARNPRQHNEKNLEAIRVSLDRFGQVEPLVVRRANREVIGGNGRLGVMRSLGWSEADVVFLDIDQPTADALGIALNRSGELAEWDYTALSQMLEEIRTVDAELFDHTGWTGEEYSTLVGEMEWDGESGLDPLLPSESNNYLRIVVEEKTDATNAAVATIKQLVEETEGLRWSTNK